MDARRKRFAAALALFAAWVVALAALAIVSGQRPVAKPRPAANVGR